MKSSGLPQKELMFGHPVGLFTLFFAEMWERFSYYGMRALLMFYMTKGFLGYGDSDAYAVYGAYTALVYMTPFFGGLLADRILGSRRAVIFGGLLMCVGQAMLMFENTAAFYTGLALLVCGNGFFKPNISTIVGTLYPKGSPKRDGGFTIFYMGVNLGAALSPLVCGYIGELYGWRFGFGLASLGMLIGVAIFVAPTIDHSAGDHDRSPGDRQGHSAGFIRMISSRQPSTCLWDWRWSSPRSSRAPPWARRFARRGGCSRVIRKNCSVPSLVSCVRIIWCTWAPWWRSPSSSCWFPASRR